MDNIVSRILSIASELIVFSVLIGAIALYGHIAYGMKSAKEWSDGMRVDMQLENVIYPFDKNNSDIDLVKGTDIINLILKHNKTYTYIIKEDDGDTGFEFSTENEREMTKNGEDGKEIWSQQFLTNYILGNEPDIKYKSQVTGVENGSAYVIFTFTKQ